MAPTDNKKDHKEAGMALPATVWASLIVLLMTSAVLTLTLGQKELVSARTTQLQQDLAVEAAILAAVKRLYDDRVAISGEPEAFQHGLWTIQVKISNEAGKINPNLADRRLLTAYFREAGYSAAQAGAMTERILDRREVGKPFHTLGELTQIKGISQVNLACFRGDLTIYTTTPRVRGELAPDRVRNALAALGKTILTEDKPSVIKPRELNETNLWRVRAVIPTGKGAFIGREAIVQLKRSADRPFATYAWDRIYGWDVEEAAGCSGQLFAGRAQNLEPGS